MKTFEALQIQNVNFLSFTFNIENYKNRKPECRNILVKSTKRNNIEAI